MDAQLIAGWQPFFTVAGGAAAALAGLLFIALSIHVREIAAHAAFRYRALATLSIPLVCWSCPDSPSFLDLQANPWAWRSWCHWRCSSLACWPGSSRPERGQ